MSDDNLVKAAIFLADRELVDRSAALHLDVSDGRSPLITIVIAGIVDAGWRLVTAAVAAA